MSIGPERIQAGFKKEANGELSLKDRLRRWLFSLVVRRTGVVAK